MNSSWVMRESEGSKITPWFPAQATAWVVMEVFFEMGKRGEK